MSRRLKPPKSVGEVLKKALEKWELGPTLRRYEVAGAWEAIAGPSIAAKSRATGVQGDGLLVEVDHPAWVQELNLLKGRLLQKIAKEFPKSGIKDIRFVLK